MLTIFGIPYCDTMKKARRWLDDNGIEYTFYDYRKLGVPEQALRNWVVQVGWETLLNRRGTTWRKLDEAVRDNIDEASAIRIMLENPSIIKRPVLESGQQLLIGFKLEDYQSLIN